MAAVQRRSTFPIAKASILTLLQAAFLAYTETVQVLYGDPGVTKLERQSVFMGGTGLDGQTWAPFGQLTVDEQYGIQFWVHAGIPGGTQQEATERAHDLFAIVDTTLRPYARTSTSIAPGLYSIAVLQKAVTEFVTDQGAACLIDGEIFCKARI